MDNLNYYLGHYLKGENLEGGNCERALKKKFEIIFQFM